MREVVRGEGMGMWPVDGGGVMVGGKVCGGCRQSVGV